MDYKSFKVPYLSRLEIKRQADLFRQRFWNDSIPIDIEKIIDVRLKIDIVPVPELQKFCDVDALIASNHRLIWVDKSKYIDERFQNRLRFSLAHEIGHFVLHKEVYKSLNIKIINDLYKSIEGIPQIQYGFLESQANNFANYLLVPREILKTEKDKAFKIINKLISVPLEKIDTKTLNSYLAIPISKKFSVSEEVISYALDDIK